MKNENKNMKNISCREIELLIDDYLEGMISTEDKKKMKEHLGGCPGCKSYLESTVIIVEKAALMARTEGKDLMSKEKQNDLWNKIEARLNEKTAAGDQKVFNISGLDDEFTGAEISSVRNVTPVSRGLRGSMRYYISGIAAVLILAFVIYGVNRFIKQNNSVIISDSMIEIGGPKWMVTNIKGNPLINNMVMKAVDSIGIGGYVVTDDSSKAELYVAGLGSVIIEPGTKVKLIKSTEGEHRIRLDYGSIDANIFAKPRTFFVESGSVTAVDLGCSYKFSMDKTGDGLLYVRSGKVALESASGRESIVPEGKFCVTKQDFGPGTPFREDSSPELKKALMEFDFGNCGGQCVNVILKNAKKTDAVTLINIIPRVDESYKILVYQKVAAYYPAPKNIPADSIPRLKKLENVNEWVDEIMYEVQKNIRENMVKVEEHMKQFDSEKWQKEWDKHWGKNVKKNWNFNYQYVPGNDSLLWYDSENGMTSEEIEELNRDMQELQEDLKIDNEEFKIEMEKVKIELKKVNEDIKREMEEVQKQVEIEKRKAESEKQKMKNRENKNKKKKNKDKDSGDDDDDE